MLRNRMRLCAALLCCVLLCSCDGIVLGGKNVEELLRAPRPSERQSAVQTALNAYLGETLQLKYPRGGAEPDPVIFADLDGDGAEEAAVLYTAESKGQNVHLSVLEQDGSGGWSIAYEVMGLSTEVAEVELAEVFGGSTQLVVGYANANLVDKYLEVYDYRDVTIYSACKQPYDAYLLGDLTGFPPTLIFAGGDEILLDDARGLHERLKKAGSKSRLIIAPGRWHAYVLYCLQENMEQDIYEINRFMTQNLSPARSLRWMRLDNAAKIYPAAKRRNWNNFFRISATLAEPVDRAVLAAALDVTVRRFPSIAVRLRRGVFWYYLEEIPHTPPIQDEKSCPLAHAPFRQVRQCAFRVLVYKDRFAVEFFHALTDGTGALVFVKSLLAEYLSEKYGISVPAEKGVLGRLEEPSPEELEDSFARYAGDVTASRAEATAWHLTGTPETDGYKDLVTLMVPADKLRSCAKDHGVSVTELLCAAMMQAILELQAEKVPNPRHRKPVKVLLPVNLRKLFPSKTLRNFASYITPEIDPRLGACSFQELCALVHHKMGLENNRWTMRAKFAANVASERSPVLRVMPLFIKNIAMKAVFDTVGECKSCLCLSNLGRVELPDVMVPYVRRMDFIIGVQAKAPHNCGVVTWGNTAYINCIRSIREPELEYHFYRVLHRLGLPVKVESNMR